MMERGMPPPPPPPPPPPQGTARERRERLKRSVAAGRTSAMAVLAYQDYKSRMAAARAEWIRRHPDEAVPATLRRRLPNGQVEQ